MFKRKGEAIRTPFAPLEYECRKYNYFCSKLLHMKTRAILMGLVAVLCFVACKKVPKECNPYKGSYTSMTVVPGMVLGSSFEDVLNCPYLDTTTLQWVDSFDFLQRIDEAPRENYFVVDGEFINHIPSRYWLYFDSAQHLYIAELTPLIDVHDSVEVSRVLREILNYNRRSYGKEETIEAFAGHHYMMHYEWWVCNGLYERVEYYTPRDSSTSGLVIYCRRNHPSRHFVE